MMTASWFAKLYEGGRQGRNRAGVAPEAETVKPKRYDPPDRVQDFAACCRTFVLC
jgi:hypothetical protein